jgi:hypothetical protein
VANRKNEDQEQLTGDEVIGKGTAEEGEFEEVDEFEEDEDIDEGDETEED